MKKSKNISLRTKPKKFSYALLIAIFSSIIALTSEAWLVLTWIALIYFAIRYYPVSKNTYNELFSDHPSMQSEPQYSKKQKNEFKGILASKDNLIQDLSDKVNDLEIQNDTLSRKLKTMSTPDENLSTIFPFNDIQEIHPSHELNTQLSMLKMDEKDIDGVKSLIRESIIESKRNHANQERQILRLFNVECNLIFSNLNHKNAEASHQKVIRSYEQLNKLFIVDNVMLNRKLLKNKLDQLNVIVQYEIALNQEAEIRKEERARIAEEQNAERELNVELKKLDKESLQFNRESDKLLKYMQKAKDDIERNIYASKIQELDEKIKQLQDNKVSVSKRLENTRAGYVYIISNIGSLGEDVYKIGVTRRLEPLDRIKELSSASVPFDFDVHAIIFSEDAPKLENTLHKHFREYELNKINPRKEFFKVDLEEIKEVVIQEHNDTVRFEMDPEAFQFRESQKLIAQAV